MPSGAAASQVGAELDRLVARAGALAARGGRRLLGIVGPPGAGKSTLASALVDALGPGRAVLVGMDGWHLADPELRRLGRWERKGAPDTFDAHGYLVLLRRLRAADEPVVYAPAFDRSLEAAIAGSVPVPATVPLVVTEGNYLLLDVPPWSALRALLDEAWYLRLPDSLRLPRLIARHLAHGRARTDAEERSHGSDQHNADLIEPSSARADLIVRL